MSNDQYLVGEIILKVQNYFYKNCDQDKRAHIYVALPNFKNEIQSLSRHRI